MQPKLEVTVTLQVIKWRLLVYKVLVHLGVWLINFGISVIDVEVVK